MNASIPIPNAKQNPKDDAARIIPTDPKLMIMMKMIPIANWNIIAAIGAPFLLVFVKNFGMLPSCPMKYRVLEDPRKAV